jgi:TonB-dependent SusC/RagA subfamily outer membrane receptor
MKNFVLFFAVAFLLILNIQAFAQNVTIKGRVTTFDKYGLSKATITAKKSGIVAESDSSGYYAIICPADDKLVFEANGFTQQKINLRNRDVADSLNINLKLGQSEKNIEIATGYGHIDKNRLTHAIEQLESGKDFSGYSSVIDIIKGRVSGVQVSPTSISIRGTSTYQGNEALLVVDGTIVDFNFVKNLPTSEVKSVNVLKGASASARYGARGMDGVIVIETKSKQ